VTPLPIFLGAPPRLSREEVAEGARTSELDLCFLPFVDRESNDQ